MASNSNSSRPPSVVTDGKKLRMTHHLSVMPGEFLQLQQALSTQKTSSSSSSTSSSSTAQNRLTTELETLMSQSKLQGGTTTSKKTIPSTSNPQQRLTMELSAHLAGQSTRQKIRTEIIDAQLVSLLSNTNPGSSGVANRTSQSNLYALHQAVVAGDHAQVQNLLGDSQNKLAVFHGDAKNHFPLYLCGLNGSQKDDNQSYRTIAVALFKAGAQLEEDVYSALTKKEFGVIQFFLHCQLPINWGQVVFIAIHEEHTAKTLVAESKVLTILQNIAQFTCDDYSALIEKNATPDYKTLLYAWGLKEYLYDAFLEAWGYLDPVTQEYSNAYSKDLLLAFIERGLNSINLIIQAAADGKASVVMLLYKVCEVDLAAARKIFSKTDQTQTGDTKDQIAQLDDGKKEQIEQLFSLAEKGGIQLQHLTIDSRKAADAKALVLKMFSQ